MATDYFTGRIRINHAVHGGFSEKYILNVPSGGTLDDGKKILFLICQYRAKILAGGYKIILASVVNSLIKRKTRMPVGHATAGILLSTESTIETQNNPQVAMWYRFQTATGRYVVRGWRGIRDLWVADNALLYGAGAYDPIVATNPAWPTIPTTSFTTPALPVATNTYASAIDAFMKVLGNWTLMYDCRGATKTTGVLRPWSAVYFNHVGTHDTGPGYSFGRARRKALV